MTTEDNVKFWSEDIKVLVAQDQLHDFFPSQGQTFEARLNSIVRLALYVSIVVGIYNKNFESIKYFIAALVVTYIVYEGRHAKSKGSEDSEGPEGLARVASVENEVGAPVLESMNNTCQMPSANNPFMNATYVDLIDNPNRHEACNISDPEVKKKADDLFNNGLYRDVSDNMGKIHAQRQFYTMPFTTVPNKQDEFARWLYYTEDNCKQNPDRCVKYEDLRGKRFIMPNEYENPVSTKRDE
jgi:hypothetical protein